MVVLNFYSFASWHSLCKYADIKTLKMKFINYKFISLLIIAIITSLSSFAQIPDDVIVSLQSGNAASLAKFFNKNIELVVIEKDDVYSKAQAQQIVSDFFKKYQVKRFDVIHDGGKKGSLYGIGNLLTNKGTFRVYFLLKENGGKSYIHQLRIEKQ